MGRKCSSHCTGRTEHREAAVVGVPREERITTEYTHILKRLELSWPLPDTPDLPEEPPVGVEDANFAGRAISNDDRPVALASRCDDSCELIIAIAAFDADLQSRAVLDAEAEATLYPRRRVLDDDNASTIARHRWLRD